jgi:hypothetical protein
MRKYKRLRRHPKVAWQLVACAGDAVVPLAADRVASP